MTSIDLFAGPGGWDVAAQQLGLNPIGVEWNADAVATARAAGHLRHHGDVTRLSPARVLAAHGSVTHLLGSPPCQGFSPAGDGLGRLALPTLARALDALQAGACIEDVRAQLATSCGDTRSALVIEPFHWIMQTRPRVIALEQVTPVLPLWQLIAEHLRSMGYSAEAGVLAAEQFDVAQTRRRAILVASLDDDVRLPEPVRSRYVKGVAQHAGDPALLSWLSMADVLDLDAGEALRSNYGTGGDASKRGMRAAHEPAPTVTSKINRNKWVGGASEVAVSIEQASVLQSFPADYPWQGTRTAQFQQVGDAVPPALAWHVLRAALGLDVQHYPSAPVEVAA